MENSKSPCNRIKYDKLEEIQQPSPPHPFMSTAALSVCVSCPDEFLSTRLDVSLPALCGCHGEFRALVIKSHLPSARPPTAWLLSAHP